MSSVTTQLADDLAATILNSNDPETVKQGVPAYLLMVDSFLKSSPDNASLLMAASSLNGSFTVFTDSQRTRLLSDKSLAYAEQAVCLKIKNICRPTAMPFNEFTLAVSQIREKDLKLIYTLGVAWTGWIQAHSDDWNAIAQLARVKVLMERVLAVDESYQTGGAHLYMGGLETLLPASLGGKPEKGKQHFEKALELGQGKNLMVKVIYAQQYARLIFDKGLHDKLLNEVIQSDPQVEDMTLINLVAQAQARQLLSESDEYF